MMIAFRSDKRGKIKARAIMAVLDFFFLDKLSNHRSNFFVHDFDALYESIEAKEVEQLSQHIGLQVEPADDEHQAWW